MKECHKIVYIQLSENLNHTYCFGPEVGNSLIETLINSWMFLTGIGFLTILFIVFGIGEKIYDMWLYISIKIFDTRIKELEKREYDNRKDFFTGIINEDAFMTEMIYIDRDVIIGYINKQIKKRLVVKWFIKNRLERFRNNRQEKQERKKSYRKPKYFRYAQLFQKIYRDRYGSTPTEQIDRIEDKTVTQIINCLIDSKNKTITTIKSEINSIINQNRLNKMKGYY